MSLLSGIYGKQNIVQNSASSKEAGADTHTDASGKLADTSKMQPGQTISGRVISSDGNGVTIKLSDGSQMNAKLESQANLSPGQNVSFTVKGNTNSQLTLSILHTNLSQDLTAAKALNLAGIPVSNSTLAMTNSMMNYGMNINSSSLQNMFQNLSSFPRVLPQTLVEMSQYGLEINESNIQSFQAFQNYESGISQGMNEIFDRGLQLYEELANQGNSEDAAKIMRTLIKSVLPMQSETAGRIQNGGNLLQNGMAAMASESGTVAAINTQYNPVLSQIISGTEQRMQGAPADNTGSSDIILPGQGNEENINSESNAKQTNLTDTNHMLQKMNEELASRGTGNEEMAGNLSGKDSYQALPFSVRYQMVSLLENAGMSNIFSAHLLSENASAEDFLLQVQQFMQPGKDKSGLTALLEHPDFRKILKGQIQETWTVKPEEVSKTTIENIYEKLHQQVKNWSEALSEVAKQDSMMGQSLSNMNQSMDFMHQMNQTYQYVQLPLKMNGTSTTGDLLVYTNKRNLVDKEGDISALLHLDMANLGMVDVYAAISTNQQVTTKFYLQDDAVLDFIASHIGELDERLEEKGYHTHSEVLKKNEEDGRPGMPDMLKKEVGTQTMAHYSFNALA